MDKELLNFLLNNDPQPQKTFYKDDRLNDILRKLDEIDNKLQSLIRNRVSKPLCEQILEKTYVIVTEKEIDPRLNPSLYVLDLDGEKALVTFKDTMDLLKLYFQVYKDEVENKLPRKLMPLFTFLKRNGLIYLDHEEKTYKLI